MRPSNDPPGAAVGGTLPGAETPGVFTTECPCCGAVITAGRKKKDVVLELLLKADMSRRDLCAATGYSHGAIEQLIRDGERTKTVCRVAVMERPDPNGRMRGNIIYSADMSRAVPGLQASMLVVSASPKPKTSRIRISCKPVDVQGTIARALAGRSAIERAWCGAE